MKETAMAARQTEKQIAHVCFTVALVRDNNEKRTFWMLLFFAYLVQECQRKNQKVHFLWRKITGKTAGVEKKQTTCLEPV